MNILVTGGAGFIGSHLSEELLRRGHCVHVIDDLSTGSIANIEHLKVHRDFKYTIASIFDSAGLAELIDWSNAVYHLAAAVGVKLIVEDPVRTIETNVHGTENVLRLAAKKKKRVIMTSTSEVYGKGGGGKKPFSEGDDLVFGATSKARWAYACSKAIDEFLALAYWRQKQVPTTVVRLFNTVGPRQTRQYGMVIPALVGQALRGKPMTVYGDGKQSRCFALVNEVVVALADLLDCPKSHGLAVNIGSPHEITIMDLAKRIKQMTGSKSKIVKIPYAKAYEEGFEDMRRRVPDISRINKLTGFKPRATLDQILQSVIDHEREVLHRPA